MILRLAIPGEPKGKDRPRSTARIVYQNGKPIAVISVYSDPAMVRAENAIREQFQREFPRHVPIIGPVMIRFTAIFEPPASFTKAQMAAARSGAMFHTSVPDVDNVFKLLTDALKGVAWIDDSQLQGGGVKRFGSVARIELSIEAMDTTDIPPSPAEKRRAAKLAEHLADPIGHPLVKVKTKAKSKRAPPRAWLNR